MPRPVWLLAALSPLLGLAACGADHSFTDAVNECGSLHQGAQIVRYTGENGYPNDGRYQVTCNDGAVLTVR